MKSPGDAATARILEKQLRQKTEIDPAQPQFLLTEIGVGYRLRRDQT